MDIKGDQLHQSSNPSFLSSKKRRRKFADLLNTQPHHISTQYPTSKFSLFSHRHTLKFPFLSKKTHLVPSVSFFMDNSLQQPTKQSRFKRICVFCGSSPGKNPSYQIAALQLGKQLVILFFSSYLHYLFIYLSLSRVRLIE